MFRSKKDVDRHVQDVLRKIKSENERNLRCYNIAQQYYKVRDYESAKYYLSLYLSVKEDSPLAHKLQAQVWEGLGDKVRALNAYKTSLEYEANQPELVLKMCELLCDTDIAMDSDRAHYWCERGADLFPHDPAIFRLKEKLLKLGGKANTIAFEELINSEMKSRPDDVSVRNRLMRLYLETGRTKAAYNHAVEMENNQMFYNQLVWYECFAQICQAYVDESPSEVDWQVYCTWVSVLDRVTSLSMSELSATKRLVDCVQAVFRMDQVLFKASSVTAPKEYSELYEHFKRHMSAQLCLHIATLILKRAKKEPSNWREATQAVSTLFFLAASSPSTTQAPSSSLLKPNWKLRLARWADEANYRVSQAGYILLALSKNAGNQFIEKVTHMATADWRQRTFQRIFMVVDYRAGVSTSHFVHSELLAKVSVKLPVHDTGDLRTCHLVPVYERVRETLHHLVWLGLEVAKHNNNKLSPDFHTYGYTGLKMLSPTDPSNMSPETLSVLDVDAFLYATVLCMAAKLEEDVLNGFYSSDRPRTIPADISNLLCTQEQLNWWNVASQVGTQHVNSNTNLIVMRQRLQRGLEVVRVDGNHGMDVLLIVKLARTFEDRAASVPTKNKGHGVLVSRAALYWNTAVPLLERIERNQAIRTSNSKMFEYPRKDLSAAEVSSILEEGRFFIACQLMNSKQDERAIEAFKPLRSPYASFNQALIYKKMAAAELKSQHKEEITSEMRSKNVILLSKARECLTITWERIRIDRRHPLHEILPEHISEVETALSGIEPDPDMVNHSDGEANMSEASVSSLSLGSPAAGDMGLQTQSTPRLNGKNHRPATTPRRHHHTYSECRHYSNGELVNVGQLLQIQTLHDEMKKMHEKIDLIVENMNAIRRDVVKLKPPGADDLYIFGDDEEYPEDMLNSQYQPTFVPPYVATPQATPTFYPPPPRGVQGTSTVTYGAPTNQQPPVIPIIPIRMPLEPTLAGFQANPNLAFYNQGALPFSEPQHLPCADFLRQSIPKPVLQPQPPPVNVVITTSDTLPTGPPPVQPTLSVTIPPQHRLGTLPLTTPLASISTPAPPHKFQIAMPAAATIPTLDKSPIVIPDEVESEDDNEVGYDPCPNFRPIIPLPNEVNVTTGEEDDDVMFENRAKLFRFVEKEWKERGVGVVKILKNRTTNKVRFLMRRDQVHKVCANHLLKPDMELNMLKDSDRALVWVANDFAEELVQLEKFCIKFKTREEAMRFKDVFNEAKMKFGQSPLKCANESNTKQLTESPAKNEVSKQQDLTMKVNVGGFTFTSPPKLKAPASENPTQDGENKKESQAPSSPFAAFSFTSQKAGGILPSNKPNVILKQSVLNPPIFAGLDSTQNKHTLFDEPREDSEVSSKEPLFAVPKDISTKKSEQQLTQQQCINVNINKDSVTTVHKPSLIQPAQPKSFFNLTPSSTPALSTTKETPKSILKETTVVTSNVTTPVVSTKSSHGAKHVLFQDTPSLSPSQQTPTLADLLTTPKTQVMDFAALSKMNENKTLQFGSSNKSSNGFQGAGSTVFGGNRLRNDSEGENAEEFVPSAEFKPVIPLPELIEVKTGEEGEEVLFDERAKLMRFDASKKEWKERGLGQMKILKDPATGITRFLMRREVVLKVCCNHRIIQSLELNPSTSSEKAWTWYAVDYSEGEPNNALFAIRFKTAELAKSFKDTVEKVQKQLREESTTKRSCPDSAPQEEVSTQKNVWKCDFCLFPNSTDCRSCKACLKNKTDHSSLPKLSELFRPKTGSWECKACYTVNGIKDSKCVSCDSPKEKPKSPAPIAQEKSSSSEPTLLEMFKPKAGSWECGGCLVRNDADKTICPACSTPKPGHESDVKESLKSSVAFGGTSGFNFGVLPTDSKSSGFSFGLKSSEDTPKSSFKFGNNSEIGESHQIPASIIQLKTDSAKNEELQQNKPVAATSFTFGQVSTSKPSSPFTFVPKTEVVASSADSTTAPSVFETKPPGNTFSFGNLFGDNAKTAFKPSFTFGAHNSPAPSTDDGNKFAFGENSRFEFNFSGVKPHRSPSGSKSPRSPVAGQETDSDPDDVDEYNTDNLVFQPVVPLPDKVPLTTGEEDEEVLYSQRAKLYRFTQGEWKERGVGDIKILSHKNNHKIRLLMRREPILKICLNHFLTPELMFSTKDDKTWLWSSPDFAEGQLTNENFCLRLKTPEKAKEFKAAIDSAQMSLKASLSKITSSVDSAASATSHEVEIVYEATVSEELRQAALKLQLPANFYSYLGAAPCPGCVGCEPESDEDQGSKLLKQTVPKTESPTVISTSLATTSVSQPFIFTVKTSSSAASVFGVATTMQSATATTPTTLFSTPTTIQSSFSFSLNTPVPTVSTTPTSKSVFSSNSQSLSVGSNSQTSVFSGTSLFQNQKFFDATPGFENVGNPSSKSGSPLLFGIHALAQSPTTLSFGSAQNKSPSLFGDSTSNPSLKETSLFNNSLSETTATSSPSLVGGQIIQTPASVFNTPVTPVDSPSSKGSSFFNNSTTFQSPQTSMFGGSSHQSPLLFGTITSPDNTQSSIFRGSSESSERLFRNLKSQAENSTDSTPTFLFKPTTSFSDIAATNKKPAFISDESRSTFSWAGAGTSVFGGNVSTPKHKDDDSCESGGEDPELERHHDPVFEPIIPLPDAIEVRTGEEEEEKEFCSRAKFYRYDTNEKEWKERGVGDMKILRHPQANTFRFLLRREQVHKVVCNQLITPELDLQPLASSDKSFCWAGMNLAEAYTEPQLERVAVRFKNSDIAAEFNTKVLECIEIVKARKKNALSEVPVELLEPAVTIEEVGTEYTEGEYLEGEESEPMFEKRATLYTLGPEKKWDKISQGELSIKYNHDMNLATVLFKKDNGDLMAIYAGPDSNIQQLTGKEVAWSGEEESTPEVVQQYKAEFCTPQAATEFIAVFNEALELSQTLDSSYLDSETED